MIERVSVSTGVRDEYGVSEIEEVLSPIIRHLQDHEGVGGVQQAMLHHYDFGGVYGGVVVLDLIHAQDVAIICG